MCQKSKQFSLDANPLPCSALEWAKRTFCEPGEHCSTLCSMDEGQLDEAAVRGNFDMALTSVLTLVCLLDKVVVGF